MSQRNMVTRKTQSASIGRSIQPGVCAYPWVLRVTNMLAAGIDLSVPALTYATQRPQHPGPLHRL